jgi:hypothetical protein
MNNTVDVTIPVEPEGPPFSPIRVTERLWVVWSAACYARDPVPALWRRPSPR